METPTHPPLSGREVPGKRYPSLSESLVLKQIGCLRQPEQLFLQVLSSGVWVLEVEDICRSNYFRVRHFKALSEVYKGGED